MKLFSILRKDLRILIRNRTEMAVLFLMPLAVILPISFALGGGDGYGITRNNRMIALPIVNYDGGPRAQDLLVAVGESLLLENRFTVEALQTLDLAEDEDCQPIFGAETDSADNPAAPESQSPTQAGGSDGPVQASEYPPAQEGGANIFVPLIESNPAYPPAEIETAETISAQATPEGTGSPNTLLSGPACNEKAARALMQRSARTAALIIPEGFSNAIDSGIQTQIQLIYDSAGDTIELQKIEQVVQGASVKVSLENQVGRGFNQMNDLILLAPENVRRTLQQQSEQPAAIQQNPALNLKKVAPMNYQLSNIPDTYQQTVPGYTVMFVFFIIAAMAGSIRVEKHNGTFRRLLNVPVGRSELAAGKMTSAIVAGFIQVLFLFLVGAVIFRLSLGRDPLAFLVLTGALVTTAAALGLAVATTSLKGVGMATGLVIAALVGGCMFPIDLMPPFLQKLSYAVPHSWAMKGYLSLMVRGLGLQEIIPHIGALLGFALVFFLIAVWRLRFDD